MRRREFLALLGAGASGLAIGCVSPRTFFASKKNAQRKPNIIIIFTDDMGYGDVGCYGGKDIPTPHIDSIARNGVRFTNGYVSCPVCSPTRAGLLTGRYQQRFGHELNPPGVGVEDRSLGLPLSESTLADDLKAAGYATGMVGKWHLGTAPEYHPLKRGFSEFFGFLAGAHSYLDSNDRRSGSILRGTEPVEEKEYLTDAFSREAVSFIDRHSKEPFFLYLAYNAVHAPMHATDKYLERFPNIADPKRRSYAAMLSAMDDGVGAVLNQLTKKGILDNTLLLFINDNGGPEQANASDNGPLRMGKSQVYEGGIRVPFLMQWPARLPKATEYAAPMISLDVRATAVAAAGAKTLSEKPLDGVDLMPYVLGRKQSPPHDTLVWRKGWSMAAVRRGDWKLVQLGVKPCELYNLADDIGEQNDLAEREPHRVNELVDILEAWESQMIEPLWGTKPGSKKPARLKIQTVK